MKIVALLRMVMTAVTESLGISLKGAEVKILGGVPDEGEPPIISVYSVPAEIDLEILTAKIIEIAGRRQETKNVDVYCFHESKEEGDRQLDAFIALMKKHRVAFEGSPKASLRRRAEIDITDIMTHRMPGTYEFKV